MHNSRSQTEMPQTHYFKDPETHPLQLTPQIQINHVSTLKSKATITQVKPSWLLCSRQFYNLWTRADSEPTQNPPQIAQLVSGTRPAMENTSGKQTSPYFFVFQIRMSIWDSNKSERPSYIVETIYSNLLAKHCWDKQSVLTEVLQLLIHIQNVFWGFTTKTSEHFGFEHCLPARPLIHIQNSAWCWLATLSGLWPSEADRIAFSAILKILWASTCVHGYWRIH